MKKLEQTIPVVIDQKTYSIVSDDSYLDHIKSGFEPDTVALFNSLLRASDLVFDVGANIGCTSILFGERCRKVYSFEPSPTTFEFLQRNLVNAGLDNVVPMNVGLGSYACESELTFAPSNRSGGFVSDKTQAGLGHTTEKIKIERADDVANRIDLPTLDFIKIDVEGFEKSVIEGAREIIDTYKPVVVLELNHWCLNAFQRITVPDFFDFLKVRFPILLAVEGNIYRDLHNPDDSYHVMYHHIINFKYINLVGAFSEERLAEFHKYFVHE
ncbi:MAG TPA: FkbM family methyltransferase [Gallionella sp.]|nr:FkbM family methyltransferase [Gallionella sp.]